MGKVKSLLDSDDVVDLQDEYLMKLSRDMAATMDFGIMSAMLEQQGWHYVEIPHFSSRLYAADVANWVEDHCQGLHHNCGTKYIFQNIEDASMFVLRWL